MLWVKAFHIISMVAWFAGLFYLPRLFVYHASATDKVLRDTFKVMEYKLYYYIMHPAAGLTLITGLALLYGYGVELYLQAAWVHAKLTLVLLLFCYHIYCGFIVRRFKQDKNNHSHVYYRIFNEIPTLLLIAIVLLVVLKPY